MNSNAQTITRHHTWDDILHDPTWRRAITIRWSDSNDSGENISDIAAETLSYEDPTDPDVIAATPVVKLIVDRAPVGQLRLLGVVPLTMADVEPGMRGRIGWAFVRGTTLVLVVLHSAFEDDIPGEHLDDGRNAHTELQLSLIRSRSGAEVRYAFSSRLARNRRNRLAIITALQRYGWRLFFGGKETDFDDPVLEGVQAAFDEKKTREFHQSTGKGEMDDLMDNLYPRNGAGLPFTHQFVRTTVTEGGRTFEKVSKKQVENHAEAVARMQILAPMIAAGQSWLAVGERAGTLEILAKAASDIKYASGRTIADLTWKGTAIKRTFTINHELFTTGKRTTRWHGKIQGGAEYGKHGKPESYTIQELRAMTARQRKKAEKGYFVVSLDWGVVMLPDALGEPCPYGVPWSTWDLMAKRYEQEASRTPSRRGTQHRDIKPLVGLHEWLAGEERYAILTNNCDTYELHVRDHLITGGWKGRPGRTLAVWRSEDHHRSLGESTADLAGQLGDQATALVVARPPHPAPPAQTKRMRLLAEASKGRAQAADIQAQMDAVPALARMLTAEGLTAQALQQYAAVPELNHELVRLLEAATAAEASAAEASDSEPNRQAHAEFATIKAVAAGLLAYPDQAPYRLAEACAVLYHDHRAEVINDGLSVRWTVTVHVTLADRSIGTHQLSGVVPNRKRSKNGVDPETFNRVARLWFTSPTAISFDDLGTHLGWQADEVRRKVATWLGYRAGIPKNFKMPVRIASRGLRSALLDCPLAEVRHAVWAALVPAEAHIADYLTAAYRDHVAATYLDSNMVWVLNWAADTHVFRRRLMDLCLEQPQRAGGVRFDAAAAALAIGETDIADFSRDYKISPRRNGAPAYPATFQRVIPFWRNHGDLPPDVKRVRPLPCPHPDCEGRQGTRTGGWCTTILRVPELAQWAVLCPDCRRVPDLTKADLRFPIGYFTPWAGPRGFASGRGGERTTRGTVAIDPGARTV